MGLFSGRNCADIDMVVLKSFLHFMPQQHKGALTLGALTDTSTELSICQSFQSLVEA